MSDYTPKTIWRIGTVNIDEDGFFWVGWMGTSSANGGPFFGPTNAGGEDAEFVMARVGRDLNKYKEDYLKMIEKRKMEEK